MESSDKPSLRLVGGHPALNLVNTVEPRVPGAEPEKDHLHNPQELLDWSVRASVIRSSEAPGVQQAWRGEQALSAARAIREALYVALLRRLEPDLKPSPAAEAALEQLTMRWAAAAARSRVSLAYGGPSPGILKVGTVAEYTVQDRLAHAAVDVLTTANIDDFRICPIAEGGCGWVFLDRSRNHSRRWCAMADCGSRVKARRLTSRRRSGD
jgi:predicted RNA-binding Zn ribbon-like protein